MTTQHTPGPWKCDGGAGVVACEMQETLRSGRTVARRVACAKGLTIEEVEANARLIAAAPDMLAALRMAEGELIAALCSGGMTLEAARKYHATRTMRAAIAKAEGR